ICCRSCHTLPQNDEDAIVDVMTTRTTMNVSLPAPLKRWVDERAKKGDYGTSSEYIRHLLRSERRRQLQEETDALLVEGLESGPASEMTHDDWDDIRRAGRERIAVNVRKRASGRAPRRR